MIAEATLCMCVGVLWSMIREFFYDVRTSSQYVSVICKDFAQRRRSNTCSGLPYSTLAKRHLNTPTEKLETLSLFAVTKRKVSEGFNEHPNFMSLAALPSKR